MMLHPELDATLRTVEAANAEEAFFEWLLDRLLEAGEKGDKPELGWKSPPIPEELRLVRLDSVRPHLQQLLGRLGGKAYSVTLCEDDWTVISELEK